LCILKNKKRDVPFAVLSRTANIFIRKKPNKGKKGEIFMNKVTKKFFMFLALTLIVVISAVSFAACGSKEKEMTGIYSYQTHAHLQERGTDWMVTYDYTVKLYDDNTYELTYKYTGQNTKDQRTTGEQHTLSYGTYTIVDDTEVVDDDGNVNGVVITLSAATRVIHYQRERLGKYFGGEYYADTATTEWTDAIKESSACDTAEEFLAEKGAGCTIKALKSTHTITSLEKDTAE